jgi:hypothetical protein
MGAMDVEAGVRQERRGRTIEGDFIVKDKDRDPWLDK